MRNSCSGWTGWNGRTGIHGKLKLTFHQNFQSGKDVLLAEDLGKAFGYGVNRVELFRGVSMDMKRGERVCIVGDNGTGKTTLLRMLMGDLVSTTGYIRVGHNVQFGYYDQGQQLLTDSNTVIEDPGTCLIVSHDRYFLNRVPTRIMELTETGLVNYLGKYDYYLEKKQQLIESANQYVASLAKAGQPGREDFASEDAQQPLSAAEERRLKKKKRRRSAGSGAGANPWKQRSSGWKRKSKASRSSSSGRRS